MAYTTINKSSDYFNTKLYTANGTTNHQITGVGFNPDFVWIKNRTTADGHVLFDEVRGANKRLVSSSSGAESTQTQDLLSFDSDGFTVGSNDNVNRGPSDNFASWNWKANGTGSANTDGTISSTVSVNTTSGFSIVKYTGNNTDNATIGHGLGAVPKVIFFKRLDTGNWVVYHHAIGTDKYLILNLTDAEATATGLCNPNSTNIVIPTAYGGQNPSSTDMIAYCFAEKTGYSKFGSYVGNGSTDGTFVYTGFKPAFILVKQTNNTASWTIIDNKRDSFNVTDKRLFPEDANEEVVSANGNTDFLSNGVKMRIGHQNINASGSTYIYMAFAEAPLVGTNNIPCTAR